MKLGCQCAGTQEEKIKNWKIEQYQTSYSAFNGYRKAFSKKSLLSCSKCGHWWRTAANYVYKLLKIL
jgi:hypothetical protein